MKANYFKRMARERKKLKHYASYVNWVLEPRNCDEALENYKEALVLGCQILMLEKVTKGKVYSLHAPNPSEVSNLGTKIQGTTEICGGSVLEASLSQPTCTKARSWKVNLSSFCESWA